MPTVSAIITYHNRSQFIGETLASVWAQTRAPDELIVVDDHSRPEEADALDQLAAGKARIVHLERNVGVAEARNEGIRQTHADYIAFLDDDDLWLPEKLATQVRYMEEHPETGVTHTAAIVFSNSGPDVVYDKKPSPLLLSIHCLRIAHVLPPCTMIRRPVLDIIGPYDANLRSYSDTDFQIRCLAKGVRVEFLPTPLTRVRRQRHGHISGNWRLHWESAGKLYTKHKELYQQLHGTSAWRLHRAFMLERCGALRGGAMGKLMKAGGRILAGGSRQTV